jgi:hypothetical protein
MDALMLWVLFSTGMCIGAAITMAYAYWQVRKMTKVKETLMETIKRKATEMDEKKESIKGRLTKASELAHAQMAIRAQLDMPSKNALHSRYKNDLGLELQQMEAQKLDLLRTVLAEGFDPMITVMHDNGSREEVPLSAYVLTATQQLNAQTGNIPPPPPNGENQAQLPGEPKKVGKFILYKGGKDDGTTH